MADRYWVGGTANWDGTAGTKWATTSGGAGGASVPTSADDVFFDANSTGTCTISSGNTGAKSINCTGFTGTLAGSAAITVSGSVTLVAGMGFTYSGTLTLNGTGTLTTAGKTLGPVAINGSGITVTLGDALNSSGSINHIQGTFDTNNYNITATSLISSATTVRTLNLGSSTLSLSATGAFNAADNTNLTFNAGTSTIICTSVTGSIIGGSSSSIGLTFYNAVFSSTAAGTRTLTGGNTFNDLTVTAASSAGVVQVAFNSKQTINGTLSTTGTAGNRRVWFRGATYGVAQTLTVNSAPSLTDADFRDIYVIGTAAPISGTRIGDLRGCRDIAFDTPKNCYRIGTGNWSDNQWSNTSGGSVSTDYFPLAQDTAVFDQNTTAGTHTMDTAVPYTGTVDMSARTSAMTLNISSGSFVIYGNWSNGAGSTISGQAPIFSGRNTQTITSAGKTFGVGMVVDSYGGSVELADALNIGGNNLTITNGTFDTKNYNVTAGLLSSSNSNVRAITLGSSTLTLAGATAVGFATSTNLTFNAGTSTINTTSSIASLNGGAGVSFYNVTLGDTGVNNRSILGANTFNNLTVTQGAVAGVINLSITANQTITGTLTVAGASPVRRIFVVSNTLGTQRTLSVGTLSADDCDFRDIAITGTAAGSSPTRAGDCGGNSGITFPAGKTVYWNLAGAQNWSATAWAPGSGGTPDINNFPLAQDTAVFDDTGSVTGTITINAAWNIGTFDASLRTSAMTLSTSTNTPFVYGDWKFGIGVTSSATTGTITFAKRSTQTITSNGIAFGCAVTINCVTGTVQLADALSLTTNNQLLSITTGTFDAVSYNVTTSLFNSSSSIARTLKLGSATWTISGSGIVWDVSNSANLNFYKGTANIVLSNTSTSARTFDGGGLSYNKLTIGGATGTSTLTINGNNQFTELASTKTVAHTIALGSTTQTFGKWTVTGTAGNVVTLTGTGTSHILAGACTSGIDYLAMGSIGFAATSPGEFYAGANSTGTAAAPVYRTAKPADSTRYWVGGTGNWSDTARWSTSSGGAGGASVPRSHDDVVFDSLSNATAYTATVNAVTGGIRMKALTIAGPLVGNVTLAGSTAMVGIHGNVTLPATGLTRTYTGAMTLSSNSTGLTFTTNGVALASAITVNGVDCGWGLGSALNAGTSVITITNGSFDTGSYNITAGALQSTNSNTRSLTLGSSTLTLNTAGGAVVLSGNVNNLTFNAGTSQINITAVGNVTFNSGGQQFYNVSFTDANVTNVISIVGGTSTVPVATSVAFNDLSFTGSSSAGLKNVSFALNAVVSGTLTFSAGSDATRRHFCRSDTIGTTRTITAAAVSMTDVDFRDITIAGGAAPASGTRIGDCKGNSGITFTAAANKYWNLAAGGNWGGAIGWATSSGGTPAINNFPLAQDTCIFEATGLNSGATITINQSYNIGTIDMSARTTNTMTLAVSQQPTIYGDWVNGTGTTVSGAVVNTFAGRTTQTFTSAGKNTPFALYVDSPGGTVVLQDAYSSSTSGNDVLTITRGTFDAATYNVTLSGSAAGVNSSNSNTRTIAVGSGTWAIAGTAGWNTATSTNLTVTGTGTISLTSASAKTFAGGGVDYSGITLNQGGVGTLSITGNNTFKTISSTAAGANTINPGNWVQRITTSWTASGSAGNILTITGASASNPGTFIFTGSGQAASVDYLTITGIRAYNLDSTWYAGANSTNNGSLGWIFAAPGGTVFNVDFSDTATGADSIAAGLLLSAAFADTATGSDAVAAGLLLSVDFSDTATGADTLTTTATLGAAFSDTATGSDTLTTIATLGVSFSDTATGTDTSSATLTLDAAFSDTATGSDALTTTATLDAAFSDTATGADALTTIATLGVAFSDTASGADALSVSTAFNVSLSETASGADELSATATLNVDFSDTATGLDAFAVAASTFNVSLSETATGLDEVSPAGSTFNVSLSDAGTITDLVAGNYLWNPIDDTQSANWQNVVTAQTPAWTAIVNTQGPNWVEIQT